MSIGYDLLLGLALGFSLTILPGPMNALIASQSVRSLRAGVITGLGAMSADLILGVLVYTLRSEVGLGSVVRWVYLVGAGVTVLLGARLLRERPEREVPSLDGLRTYSHAVALGISNPFQVLWWLTAGLAFAYLGGVGLFAGLFGAIAVWIVAFPYALHRGTRRRPDLGRAVTYVSAAIMFVFAAYFVLLAV